MTAVEWLVQNIPDLGKYIPFGVSMELHAKFQQALEMEKEQIMDAFDECGNWQDKYSDAEHYYKETYKKNKCTCKNAELEKDSLVPVYCHNCNVYIQRNL